MLKNFLRSMASQMGRDAGRAISQKSVNQSNPESVSVGQGGIKFKRNMGYIPIGKLEQLQEKHPYKLKKFTVLNLILKVSLLGLVVFILSTFGWLIPVLLTIAFLYSLTVKHKSGSFNEPIVEQIKIRDRRYKVGYRSEYQNATANFKTDATKKDKFIYRAEWGLLALLSVLVYSNFNSYEMAKKKAENVEIIDTHILKKRVTFKKSPDVYSGGLALKEGEKIRQIESPKTDSQYVAFFTDDYSVVYLKKKNWEKIKSSSDTKKSATNTLDESRISKTTSFREKPDGKTIRRVKVGENVSVIKKEKYWTKVKIKNKQGYIKTACISF